MNRYRIEHAVVLTASFLLGAIMAISIAPGDVLLWVFAGTILALFCREHFVHDFGGELFWRSHAGHRARKTPLGHGH